MNNNPNTQSDNTKNPKYTNLTLTIVADITANYGETLGNIATIHTVNRNGKKYAIRSRESIKREVMVQSGLYDDLSVAVDGAAQKNIYHTDENNKEKRIGADTCKALEGGYFATVKEGSDKGCTFTRKSSIYFSDAIATTPLIGETRFHTNLHFAMKYAEDNNKNVQKDAKEIGLNPYQYQFDKGYKVYSVTIDLDKICVDDNIKVDNSKVSSLDADKEKTNRVINILDAIQTLTLDVKGSRDFAEPLFVIGGLSNVRTHYFEHALCVEEDRIRITEQLKYRLNDENSIFNCGMCEGCFENEKEIIKEIEGEEGTTNKKVMTVDKFFEILKENVNECYGISTKENDEPSVE